MQSSDAGANILADDDANYLNVPCRPCKTHFVGQSLSIDNEE
jgi:hypothetical protein